MSAQEKYELETGDTEPSDQGGDFQEWFLRYVTWLEKRVEEER